MRYRQTMRAGFARGMVVAAALALLGTAHADGWSSFAGGVTGAANTVGNGVVGAANTVGNGLQQGGQVAGKWVVDGWGKVNEEGNRVFNKGTANAIAEVGKKSYAATLEGGKSAYNTSQGLVNAGLDEAKKAAFKAAAAKAIQDNRGTLLLLRRNLNVLAGDEETKNLVRQIIAAAMTKTMTKELWVNTVKLGAKLGMFSFMPGAVIPNGNCSWGITAGGNVSYIAGAAGSVGVIASCGRDPDGSLKIGLITSVGGLLGASFGADGGVAVFWSPSTVDKAEGGYVGIGLTGAIEAVGGSIGVQWTVPSNFTGSISGVPSFTLGYAAGGEFSSAVTGGYTFVPVKQSYSP